MSQIKYMFHKLRIKMQFITYDSKNQCTGSGRVFNQKVGLWIRIKCFADPDPAVFLTADPYQLLNADSNPDQALKNHVKDFLTKEFSVVEKNP